MKFSTVIQSAAATAAIFASSAAAQSTTVDPIVTKGKHFFYKTNGTEFFIRGVAYQQDYVANATAATNADYTDPLADITSCNRDIPYLVELRTNVIRTYAIDPTQNHTACMNAFAAAGIYVISDLSAPDTSIDRDDPAWTTDLYNRYTAVIDNMAQYDNVIGFFAGNEVSNSYNTTAASAYVKAAVRDSKAYIVSQKYRTMYVGYATYDGDIRNQLADYFNCGDTADSIDFWGYNVYSWCGDSTYYASGYENRTEFFANYSVPAFFAEYGCNEVTPRTFTDVPVLFGPNMTGVWSGGIVYQYFQEVNNFGLITLVNSATVSTLADFSYLSVQMATVSPSLTAMSDYTTTSLAAQACPTVDSDWEAVSSPLPPTPNTALCNCMIESLSCSVKNSSSADVYGTLFDYICAQDSSACEGILTNGTTGVYGAYSGCTSEQQLSYVMNRYYIDQDSASTACDFGGNATITSSATAGSTCSSLLSEAGVSGTGSVASVTGKSSGTGTAGSSSTTASSTSTSTKKGAASGINVPAYEFGMLHVGLYIAGAVLTGAGMILL